MKIIDYCKSNKKMGQDSANFKEELPAPREALINVG